VVWRVRFGKGPQISEGVWVMIRVHNHNYASPGKFRQIVRGFDLSGRQPGDVSLSALPAHKNQVVGVGFSSRISRHFRAGTGDDYHPIAIRIHAAIPIILGSDRRRPHKGRYQS
jgi:hypothetical protein